MTTRDPRVPDRVLPPRGSGQVELRVGAPDGQRPDAEPPDIGFLFNSNNRTLVGVYGINPTEDFIWFLVEVEGSPPIRIDLPPGTSTKQQVTLGTPARTRTTTKRVTERRPVAEEVEVLPVERLVVERQFTNPVRESPVVLSVTRTQVTTGTSHNIAMPATVEADDLLLAVETWNGDGSNTTNGVPSGWAEDGEVNDAPFGYIAAMVKKAVGNEDGTNVNFTTNSSAPVICHVYRYEAGSWDDSGTAAAAVQLGGRATGNSGSPNPGSLSPAWGSAANSWIAVAQSTGDVTFSAVPSGYTDAGQNQLDGSEGELALNTAYRTNEAASEDPGAFSSQSFFWLAATIAVKPSTAAPPAEASGTVEGEGSLTATGHVTKRAAGTTEGEGELTATGHVTSKAAGQVVGEGETTATGHTTPKAHGQVQGEGELTATGLTPALPPPEASGSVVGEGALTATGHVTPKAAGQVTGEGQLTATGQVTPRAAGQVAGEGSLTATGLAPSQVPSAFGVVSGEGALTAVGAATPKAAGVAEGWGVVSATGYRASEASGTVEGEGELVAVGAGQNIIVRPPGLTRATRAPGPTDVAPTKDRRGVGPGEGASKVGK